MEEMIVEDMQQGKLPAEGAEIHGRAVLQTGQIML